MSDDEGDSERTVHLMDMLLSSTIMAFKDAGDLQSIEACDLRDEGM